MDEIHQQIRQLTSRDDGLAETAVELLARRGSAALLALRDLLLSPIPDDRWWAVRTAAAIDHPQASRLLIQGIGDESHLVRQAAALGLRLRPSLEAIPVLSKALEDSDRLTARLASEALAAYGAVDALGHALRSPSTSVRIEAARALADIDDPAVVPHLFHALEDSSVSVNFWAEHGLERHGVGMVFFSP